MFTMKVSLHLFLRYFLFCKLINYYLLNVFQ